MAIVSGRHRATGSSEEIFRSRYSRNKGSIYLQPATGGKKSKPAQERKALAEKNRLTIAQGGRMLGAHCNRHTGVASGVSLLNHTHYQVIFENLSVA